MNILPFLVFLSLFLLVASRHLSPLAPLRKMFSSIFKGITFSQFYLHGRSHSTQTGYINHRKAYVSPDILEDPTLDLRGKVYMITGANAGIGYEVTKFLATKNATVYMICRSPDRAIKAQESIVKETKNENVHVLLCDCSLQSEIRKTWDEFLNHQDKNYKNRRLDGLMCNAGVLLNDKQLSTEGVEITFATHLVYGSYLLGKLAIPLLQNTQGSRMVFVSSGGMYNTKFPSWEHAASINSKYKYDGQLAYAFAKRGQVLLAERWAKEYPAIKFVSCHPGWVLTEALDAAYSKDEQKYLQPLRTPWEGAEGIAWLHVVDDKQIENGAFYLDRTPQSKHFSGIFMTEGSYTKNSDYEIDQMMCNLDRYCQGSKGNVWIPSKEKIDENLNARNTPLSATTSINVDLDRFITRWHVLASIPTSLETNAYDAYENYKMNPNTKNIDVLFQYKNRGETKENESRLTGTVVNAPVNTHWSVDLKVAGINLPTRLSYLILHVDESYSYTIVSVPSRDYLWIMTKEKPNTKLDSSSVLTNTMSKEKENEIMNNAVEMCYKLGFDISKIRMVPYSS